MKIFERSTGMSEFDLMWSCQFGFPRWWFGRCRGVVFLFIMIVFLPYACSDDSNLSQTSPDSARYQVVHINVSYSDFNTRKEVVRQYSGRYGRQSVISSVSGLVMQAMNVVTKAGGQQVVNNFGCATYSNTKFPSENWIALVERGECSFANKIKIATQEHNAAAIAIYNNITTSTATLMDHGQAPSSIAVLMSKEDGKEIVSLIDKGYTVYMHMKPGPIEFIPSQVQNSISKTSVLFVSISFIVLMIVSLAWLVFYYIQRFRYSHAKERLARRLACAAKKAIAKIPQRTLRSGDKELDSDYDQCAVCIESYKFHEVIRILPCRHVFHKSCVDPWLQDQRSCPMCKMDILRAYGMQIGGSQESLRPDTEVGHVIMVNHEEPEVSSHVEDNHTDSVKVALVSHTCLHFCNAGNESDQTSDSLLQGAVGGSDVPSSSASTVSSKGSSLSRAGSSDKSESINSETKALIGKGKDGKKRWKSDETCDGDRDEDFENVTKDRETVKLNMDAAKGDAENREMLQP